MNKSRNFLVLAFLCASIPLTGYSQVTAAKPAVKPKAAPAKPSSSAKATTGSVDPALLQPVALTAKAPDVYDVKFVTTAGDFVVEVTRAWAPRGADRFYNLVRHHFYDGASFFRVLPGFMAQFGINAHPEISQAWERAIIKDDTVVESNHRGYLSFAMAGPNTRTTQVFINYGNNQTLDSNGFAPFGVVTGDGMAVVDKFYSGYGEGAPDGKGPDQGLIGSRGSSYLEKGFPKLDSIKSATLMPAAAKAPASK